MDESILTTIKEQLGITEDCAHFDPVIIANINSVFSTLHQLGVGPAIRFHITGSNETWKDFFGDGIELNSVKTYVYLKVKLLFDPPTSSAILSAFERMIKEEEWRLNVSAETECAACSL